MTASLRPFARSRGLRALGVLAWLALVFSSLGMTAWPPAAAAHVAPHAMPHAAVAQAANGGMVHTHDCCPDHAGAPTHASCSCDGLCASVLPPVPALQLSFLSPASMPALSGGEPPSVVRAPPLRPPQA